MFGISFVTCWYFLIPTSDFESWDFINLLSQFIPLITLSNYSSYYSICILILISVSCLSFLIESYMWDLLRTKNIGLKFSLQCPLDLSLLCHYLQEEHCFDVKNAVCPVCALNLGKDVAGHFKVHHSNSIKKRSRKWGFWNFYAGRNTLGDLSSKNGLDNANGSAPDPLLSPFLFSAPYSEI